MMANKNRERIVLEFIKSVKPYSVGDVAGFEPTTAASLISRGLARRYNKYGYGSSGRRYLTREMRRIERINDGLDDGDYITK